MIGLQAGYSDFGGKEHAIRRSYADRRPDLSGQSVCGMAWCLPSGAAFDPKAPRSCKACAKKVERERSALEPVGAHEKSTTSRLAAGEGPTGRSSPGVDPTVSSAEHDAGEPPLARAFGVDRQGKESEK